MSGWIVGNKPIFPGGLWEIRKTLRFENFDNPGFIKFGQPQAENFEDLGGVLCRKCFRIALRNVKTHPK